VAGEEVRDIRFGAASHGRAFIADPLAAPIADAPDRGWIAA
jgi:hypothetical protein